MAKEKQIEFLYSAIKDAQELIRFTDTKSAVSITILGAYIVAIFSLIDKMNKYFYYYSFWVWMLFVAFLMLLILCIVHIARIIKPTNNPVDNVDIEKTNMPKIKFYLPDNRYTYGKFLTHIAAIHL